MDQIGAWTVNGPESGRAFDRLAAVLAAGGAPALAQAARRSAGEARTSWFVLEAGRRAARSAP
jgi:hypothetical protein